MSEGANSHAPLTRAERATLALGRFINEQPTAKRLQQAFLTRVNQTWVRYAIGRRVFADNIEWLVDPPSQGGVVVCLNHRSYFDAYITMWAIYEQGTTWVRKMYFPVRSNFFYERPLGAAVNLLIGGGALYPPIFRDTSKSELNRDALRRVVRYLGEPGALVGLHPEGTRNKGDDPYSLLPAQPGIGQIVLQARPLVVPAFVNGLSNSYVSDITSTYRRDIRRENPIIIVFGQPLDYSDLSAQKPRAALYKKMSDRIRDAIIELGKREKALREDCARGEIGDDNPGWAMNRAFR
ncbi:MAG TPA: lysophospholipid acyltransferase family protein [Kofleriaceae bacterium]|nr:lysophospholipid acyltransferase family protein [Kofleriaceae bacterium]